MPPNILIVDDEENLTLLLERFLAKLGYSCTRTTDPEKALSLASHISYDIVLTDLEMPGLGGIELLKRIKEVSPLTRVVIITGFGTIQSTVEAMKWGAEDYLTKPVDFTAFEALIRSIVESGAGRPEDVAPGFGPFIGTSPVMQKVYHLIRKAAACGLTILVQGENGTGKELAARAVHETSDRSRHPFIPIDCGALNENLVESELFGHVKGAFTGAGKNKEGLLKAAGAGTVFLDEIADVSPSVQVKLLRTIQEREVRPVGSNTAEKFRARIITATNRDLTAAVAEGLFREDLFYRLHVIPINLPPLRERRDDIPLLTRKFIAAHAKTTRVTGITKRALDRLCYYPWPGNVRELENCINNATVMCEGHKLDIPDLPEKITRADQNLPPAAPDLIRGSGIKTLKEYEKDIITMTLRQTRGDKEKAALLLGIGLSTLYKKIKDYNL